MEIKIGLTKENIKILQNIKENNPDIVFKVSMEEQLIYVEFIKLEISAEDYIKIYEGFIDDVKKALLDVNIPHKEQINGNIYIIEEIQGKKVLLTLSVDNTVALEELKLEYPGKTQGEILNELISIGSNSLSR